MVGSLLRLRRVDPTEGVRVPEKKTHHRRFIKVNPKNSREKNEDKIPTPINIKVNVPRSPAGPRSKIRTGVGIKNEENSHPVTNTRF